MSKENEVFTDDLVKRLCDRRVCSPAQNSCRNDWVINQAADRIEQLVATNEELEAENHLLKTSGIVEVAVRNPNVMEYMKHWEGRAEAAEAKLAAMSQSKEHFKRAAEKQKQRCHKLRHRQRAIMFALKNVKNCTSLDAAKFVACIAIGGWEDDELVYKSRTTLAELTGGKDE